MLAGLWYHWIVGVAMTKPLCSFPVGERERVARHRTAGREEGGLGFLAAQDFLTRRKRAVRAGATVVEANEAAKEVESEPLRT